MLTQIILAAILGGGNCALVGFFLSNLRLPFMGVCLSHAALAGAVFAPLLGLPVLPFAFAVSLLTAALIGPVADRAGVEANTSMAILFSLMMGIAFFGIGITPGPKSDALSLIWGSILFVRATELKWMVAVAVITILFVLLFGKELRAVMFSRTIAASCGVREGLVYYLLLAVAGATITINLETVGGLMLFSLIVNPAAAATRITERYNLALPLSVVLGVVAALGGLGISYLFNAPAGASIVIVSSTLFLLAVFIRKFRGLR